MTVAAPPHNPGALVEYVFFLDAQDDQGTMSQTGRCSYKAAERLASAAEDKLKLVDVSGSPTVRRHLRNATDGHELFWLSAHEGETVIITVGRPPSPRAAQNTWKKAIEEADALTDAVDPHAIKVRVLVGTGNPQKIRTSSEALFSRPFELSAQASWGSLLASRLKGPFIVAVKQDSLAQAEQFVSWEKFGYALYHFTKGEAQWRNYLDNRKKLRGHEATVDRVVNVAPGSAAANGEESDESALTEKLFNAGKAIRYILKSVSHASLNIKKARTNVALVLQGVFSADYGIVTGMNYQLSFYEEILAAEAEILRERSAELDRMTQQSQRKMQLEAAHRSEALLVAAHTVEFIVVLYYTLAAWSLVVGKTEFQAVPWFWKLLWGILVSGLAVFATYRVLQKSGETWALFVLFIIGLFALVFAAIFHGAL